MDHKAYLLTKDYDHLLDMDFDASHIPFPESDHFAARMIGPGNFDLPGIIYCEANFSFIPKLDFPIVDVTDAVFSTKMLDVIISLGLRTFRKVPVVMLDDTYLDYQFDKAGKLKADVKRDESYSAIHLPGYEPVFDYAASVYEEDELFPGEVGFIQKLVLKKPAEGFPPLFRIKEKAAELFVSAAAKDKLEACGIVGCVFEEVAVSE